MARTTIDIDDAACERVVRRFSLSTEKDAVNTALRLVAEEPMGLQEALAMEGTGWEGDLEVMRESRTW